MIDKPMPRRGVVGRGGALPSLESLSGEPREWHASLPYTRLTDYGMDAADARELLWRTARDEEWVSVAAEIGHRQLVRANEAGASGTAATQLAAIRAGAAAINVAQIVINQDTARKRALYREFQDAVGRYAQLKGGIERVSLPYGDGVVEGWLILPPSAPSGAVAVWGGLSGWGAAYLAVGEALAARGLACLLAEGPGQGSTRLESHIYASENTLAGYRRFVDFLETDSRTSGLPVGIYGNSIGGMLAARVCAADTRVRACAVNCSPVAADLPDAVGPREQFLAFLGLADGGDHSSDLIRGLHFLPKRHRLRSPLLVLHGGADQLVTQQDAAAYLEAVRDIDAAELVHWPDGEHTLYNHSVERNEVVADWFREQLLRPGSLESLAG
ncbi:alpha/beta hydrolase family protein [Microbacterium trichothecenolyticum]|uniref:alpha/beta hydrolase family protein n=1 Tax=Microbacterium trichothecenolyticum TaxID=69370 RepID=UPI0035BE5EC8